MGEASGGIPQHIGLLAGVSPGAVPSARHSGGFSTDV